MLRAVANHGKHGTHGRFCLRFPVLVGREQPRMHGKRGSGILSASCGNGNHLSTEAVGKPLLPWGSDAKVVEVCAKAARRGAHLRLLDS